MYFIMWEHLTNLVKRYPSIYSANELPFDNRDAHYHFCYWCWVDLYPLWDTGGFDGLTVPASRDCACSVNWINPFIYGMDRLTKPEGRRMIESQPEIIGLHIGRFAIEDWKVAVFTQLFCYYMVGQATRIRCGFLLLACRDKLY